MPKESAEPIFVGCELLIRKDDSLLLGLRGKACYGAGTWALPGGHLEFGERLVDAACREALEELGATVSPEELRLISLVDGIQANKSHHVHISFELTNPTWDPRVMEPESCDEWRYFPLSDLPQNFFAPHENIIKNYLSKNLY